MADPTILIPEALEELPQWMSMAMEREDLALVAELSAQLAAGGRSWPAQRGGATTLGLRSCLRSDSSGTDCEVLGSERRPIQVHSPPESMVTRSQSFQADSGHCDSAESVAIPGTPPGAANDSTVVSVGVQSGEEQDGFVSVVSSRRIRRGRGDKVTPTTLFPIQGN